MKYLQITMLVTVMALLFSSCQTPRQSTSDEDVNIEVAQSVSIPKDGSGPIAGIKPIDNARVVTFSKVGEQFPVKNGESVNFIYDGVDPERTYVKYESTDEGYNLELAYRSDPVYIEFKNLCQCYIVANPALTTCNVPKTLRLEQIVWTPRKDGTWEIRIGATERGCRSQSLNELQKMRNREYEGSVPKMK